MAGKTYRTLIADALEDLGNENLEKFRVQLLEKKRDGPRIRRARVDDKSYLELSGLLVDVYTGYKAIEVTEQLLKEIGCNRVASELVEDAEELQQATPNTSSQGASGGSAAKQQEHFVDHHRIQLTNRVTNVDPILDLLLSEKVINQEQYDEIRKIPTSQNQMRFLFSKILKTSKTKDIFLSALEEQELCLIEDLRGD